MGGFLDHLGGLAKQKLRNGRISGQVQRAGSAGTRVFYDMEANHGGKDRCVAQQGLLRADLGARFQEVGG